jgi:flagellar biosynthesis protein FliQ
VLLITALVVGLAVSLLQAVTQINEMPRCPSCPS